MTIKLAVMVLLLSVVLAGDLVLQVPALSPRPATASPSVSPSANPSVNVSFSTFTPFTSGAEYDFSPAILPALDGRSWVFWETAPLSTPWNGSIHYKINNGSSWSSEQVAVQGIICGVTCPPTVQNVRPSVAQLRNGTIYLSYSSNRTGTFQVFLKRFNPIPGWSADFQLTNASVDQLDSSLLAASDGSLWVFYDRFGATSTDIFYKVNRNGSWSSEAALTSSSFPVQNQEPVEFQARDGRIWAVWSQAQDLAQTVVHIAYAIYNGATWSAPTLVTSSSNPDADPTGIQDSNGTIWLAWSRNIPYFCPGGGCFQHDLFYITSTTNGVSWSAEIALTNDTACVDPFCFDDVQPSIAQWRDGKAYIFWRTDRDPAGYWNLYYVSTTILPYHNLAMTKITDGPSILRVGRLLSVNVTVANTGAFTETFQLNVQFTNKTTFTVSKTLTLAASLTTTYTIVWNTTVAPYGKYTVSANIPPVPFEFITSDNSMTVLGKIIISPPGDVNLDGKDNIFDVAMVALAFGSKPGDPTWNPAADLNYDGKIDIVDVAIVAFWFGASV